MLDFVSVFLFLFFFFQAEDGIRDYKVTGVQTCALPISAPGQIAARTLRDTYRIEQVDAATRVYGVAGDPIAHSLSPIMLNTAFRRENRSEERRVGKECRSRWSPYH